MLSLEALGKELQDEGSTNSALIPLVSTFLQCQQLSLGPMRGQVSLHFNKDTTIWCYVQEVNQMAGPGNQDNLETAEGAQLRGQERELAGTEKVYMIITFQE